MIKKIILASVRAVAILLLVGVVAVFICATHVSNEAKLSDKLRQYKEAYQAIPVTMTVQGSIDPWIIDLFTGNNPVEIIDRSSESSEPTLYSLSEYLKDVRIKMSKGITRINDCPVLDQTTHQNPDLIGITSLPSDEQLLPENGCEITWYEGYDESVLGGEELVCLVPEGKVKDYDNGNGEAALYLFFSWGRMENGAYVEVSRAEYECTLKIVGTYTAGDEMSIYCPFSIIEQVYSGLKDLPDPDSISATIADNMLLDEFREKASFFFSNLSESPQDVSDGLRVLYSSKTYVFTNDHSTLDIADDDLFDYSAMVFEDSIELNRTITMNVVAVSVAAGVLVAFLMIFLRKRGIAQKRTNGKSIPGIYFGFILEQMIYIILGIAAGGAYYMWKPMDKLLLFASVYFVVFAIASVIPMSIIIFKLSKTMKKDRSAKVERLPKDRGGIILRTLKRVKRANVSAVALLLFAAVITVAICGLEASNAAKLRDYEEARLSLPLTITVTDPWGGFKVMSYVNGEPEWNARNFYIQNWIYDLFTTREPVEFYDVSDVVDPRNNQDELSKKKRETTPKGLSLAEYVKDLQLKMSIQIGRVNAQEFNAPELIGITSLSCDTQLLPEDGCEITWYDGYDESIFEGKEWVGLVPEGKVEQYDNGNGEAVLDFIVQKVSFTLVNGELVKEVEESVTQYTVKIAGTYTGGDWNSIYCPIPVVKQACSELDTWMSVYSLSATLADNSRLDEFREKMSLCFTEASPDAELTAWGYYADSLYNEFYRYALDIGNEELDVMAAELEESIESNRKVTQILLVLSAVAAFVTVSVTIRRRKLDIALMRTAGETRPSVYFSLVLEQMICIILGIAVGGACFLWKPIDKLLIFALICFVAIVLVTAIFMCKKLIKTIREVQS